MRIDDWLYLVFPEAKQAGRDIMFECPRCGPSKSGSPNAYYTPSNYKFICFKCMLSGPIESLVAYVEGCSRDDVGNIVDLSRKVVWEAPELDIEVELPPEAKKLWTGDRRGTLTKRIHSYALARGWGVEKSEKYNLMYCTLGSYRGRILIPFYEGGELVGFQGRTVLPQGFPKYLGPSCRHTIANIDNQNPGEISLLHEGPADFLATDGMSKQGSYLTRHQKNLLIGLGNPILVYGDKDAKDKALDSAIAIMKHLETYIYIQHEADDPADAGLLEKVRLFKRSVRVSKFSIPRLKLLTKQ